MRLLFRWETIAALALTALAAPAQAADWPDNVTTRLEATALVQTLNGDILASSSATFELDRWCADHRLAHAGTKVVAHLVRGVAKPATAEQRQRLGVAPDETINYRRVELVCGDKLLSVADNWYVPGRLTPDMNRALETTDIAFGRAVQALHFTRRTFALKVMWWPLAEGWETRPLPIIAAGAILAIPADLLEHRAVLSTAAGVPFSEVRETYQRALMDFPLPPPQ